MVLVTMVYQNLLRHILNVQRLQENTINSDGAFGMWIAYISAVSLIHETYKYLHTLVLEQNSIM